MTKGSTSILGLGHAAGAYLLWGLISLYFRATAFMPSFELLGHRVLWSLVVTSLGVLVLVPRAEFKALFADRRKMMGLFLSGLFVVSNWAMFIWAVANGRAVEAGLGYFICPLVSVALGAWLFQERMSRVQLIGLAIVAGGVAWTSSAFGHVPWISIYLAGTFAAYGLARKILKVPALLGLFAETLLVAPFALAYLFWLEGQGQGHFLGTDPARQGLVMAVGIVTVVPLLFFAGAANRLSLTAIGLMQYLNPTVQVGLAVLVYHEPFTAQHGVTFATIWAGLALFSLAQFLPRLRREKPGDRPAEPVLSMDN